MKLLITAILALSLIACGGEGSDEAPAELQPENIQEDVIWRVYGYEADDCPDHWIDTTVYGEGNNVYYVRTCLLKEGEKFVRHSVDNESWKCETPIIEILESDSFPHGLTVEYCPEHSVWGKRKR